MRTTLEIDDDVMLAAKEIARLKNQGVSRAISDLARRGLVSEASPIVEMQHGIPVWKRKPGAIAITGEMVRIFLTAIEHPRVQCQQFGTQPTYADISLRTERNPVLWKKS